MIAITNVRGVRGVGYVSSRSRTFAVPGSARTVERLQARADRQRMQIAPVGIGNGFATVPSWTWWAGGGLLAGLIGGALLFKK